MVPAWRKLSVSPFFLCWQGRMRSGKRLRLKINLQQQQETWQRYFPQINNHNFALFLRQLAQQYPEAVPLTSFKNFF